MGIATNEVDPAPAPRAGEAYPATTGMIAALCDLEKWAEANESRSYQLMSRREKPGYRRSFEVTLLEQNEQQLFDKIGFARRKSYCYSFAELIEAAFRDLRGDQSTSEE